MITIGVNITEEDLLQGYLRKWSTPEPRVPEASASGETNSALLDALMHDEDNSSLVEQILQMSWEGGPEPTAK